MALSFSLLITSLVLAGCYSVSRTYVDTGYEVRIGRKLVALKDEALIRYESGREIGGDKVETLSRALYYTGTADTSISFLWQVFQRSNRGSGAVHKSSFKYSISAIPFTMTVRGFDIQIHEADHHHVSYTILRAEPQDLGESQDN